MNSQEKIDKCIEIVKEKHPLSPDQESQLRLFLTIDTQASLRYLIPRGNHKKVIYHTTPYRNLGTKPKSIIFDELQNKHTL